MKAIRSLAPRLASAVAAISLTSCFHSETTVHLNKDGSGTIVEETLLGAQSLTLISQTFPGIENGGDAAKDPIKELFSEAHSKKRAAEQLGLGVTFQKSELIEQGGFKGARVTYKFEDINQIKVSDSTSIHNTSPGITEVKAVESIRFNYDDGKLSIKVPLANIGRAREMPDLDSPEGQQMKQMFADMKMSLKLVVDSGIEETTASYRDGNTITLMEMNFGKLIENAEGFKKLQSIDQKDPAAAIEALKGIDGVKVETKEEITVKVK